MSVQRNGYIITGMKFEYDGDLSERLYELGYTDSAFNHKYPDILSLGDGMSGEYLIIGKCHKKTGNWQDLDDNRIGDDNGIIEELTIPQDDMVIDLIEKLYNITGKYAQVKKYTLYFYR